MALDKSDVLMNYLMKRHLKSNAEKGRKLAGTRKIQQNRYLVTSQHEIERDGKKETVQSQKPELKRALWGVSKISSSLTIVSS